MRKFGRNLGAGAEHNGIDGPHCCGAAAEQHCEEAKQA